MRHFGTTVIDYLRTMRYLTLLLLAFLNTGFSQTKLDTITMKNVLACNNGTWNVEKPIQLDWVNTDIENVKKLNQLNKQSNSITDIEKIFPGFIKPIGNCKSTTYDCGYNLKTTDHEFYGGYGSVHVSALYFEDKIIKIRFTIHSPGQIVYTYLSSVVEFPLKCKYNNLIYDKIIEDNLKEYESKFGALSLEIEDNNTKRKDVFDFFADVLSGSSLQQPFYILNGISYPTFDLIRYLIVSNDIDALKKLIYSPSPTARLFVANTLKHIEKKQKIHLDRKDNQRIAEIFKNSEKIKGGVVSCWVGKFGYDYYDVTNNFEEYLLTK